MSDIPEIRMAERCATCAFRTGTPANTDGLTLTLARLCVATCEPFLCHEGDRPAMCAGWADAAAAKSANGDYKRLPEWKRVVYRTCTNAIADFQEGKPVDDLPERIAVALKLLPPDEDEVRVAIDRNQRNVDESLAVAETSSPAKAATAKEGL